MTKLLILALFLSGCEAACTGACYDEVLRAAGPGAEIRRRPHHSGWFVKQSDGSVWIYHTENLNNCAVTGKEKIF